MRFRIPSTAASVFVVALCLVAVLALSGCQTAQEGTSGGGTVRNTALSPVQALQTERVDGFELATTPRPFVFPQDHGAHPTFRTEWWYFVGNLADEQGRPFGFQLTFFRHADQPHAIDRPSDWAYRDLYFANFALSDIEGNRFHAFERFARGAVGLAGAEAEPFRVWIEDWSVTRQPGPSIAPGQDGGGMLPAVLEASDGDVGLRLELLSSPDPALVGDGGLSIKGSEPGAASHYYSLSRIQSRGTVTLGDRRFDVQGDIWLDREWSTSTLSASHSGWDWFALHLDGGDTLMFYQLRLKEGGVEPASHGILVRPDGTSVDLKLEDYVLEVRDTWTSPKGIQYPAAWHIEVPRLEIDFEIRPRMADQELRLSVTYWEGAVEFEGTREGRPVDGLGYVELVGYSELL